MRRTVLLGLAATFLLPALSFGQSAAQPPHAWLFGTWTGGIFPAPDHVSAEACFSQPVVIFTRDLVMRATLTEQTLTQRVIETARAGQGGVEFRFAAAPAAAPSLLGPAPGSVGFGCESADALHVVRRGENEIAFPGCADFPNPLVRCQTDSGARLRR